MIDRDIANLKGISDEKAIITKKIDIYKDKINILVESGFNLNNLNKKR